MISKTVLALVAGPDSDPGRIANEGVRAQVNRLGIDQAGRYGAARLPRRDNFRRRQAPQRT